MGHIKPTPTEGGCKDEAVAAITAAFPGAHGGPVHWGDPAALGIGDLAAPDWGDAVQLRRARAEKGGRDAEEEADEVPMFWACGVTPQTAIMEAKLPCTVITHAPGRMFICDVMDRDLEVPTGE